MLTVGYRASYAGRGTDHSVDLLVETYSWNRLYPLQSLFIERSSGWARDSRMQPLLKKRLLRGQESVYPRSIMLNSFSSSRR